MLCIGFGIGFGFGFGKDGLKEAGNHPCVLGVGVDAQGHIGVAVAQGLGHAGHIRPVGDGQGSEGVAKSVGVQMLDAVLFGKEPQVVVHTGGVHRPAVLLPEHKPLPLPGAVFLQ